MYHYDVVNDKCVKLAAIYDIALDMELELEMSLITAHTFICQGKKGSNCCKTTCTLILPGWMSTYEMSECLAHFAPTDGAIGIPFLRLYKIVCSTTTIIRHGQDTWWETYVLIYRKVVQLAL